MVIIRICVLFFSCFWASCLYAQIDTTNVIKDTVQHSLPRQPLLLQDTVKANESTAAITKPFHDPRKATRRSAIIPGWGQAYNKEYWKIPIVYAALGITAIIYVDGTVWYKRTRDAYNIRIAKDTAHFANIYPDLQRLDAYALQRYRNQFRQQRDYATLWFVIFWALNVADATVFGHLKNFDISDDLSMKASPTYNAAFKAPGINLVFNFKNPRKTAVVKW